MPHADMLWIFPRNRQYFLPGRSSAVRPFVVSGDADVIDPMIY
jgi:hypothetical protein